MDDKEKILNYLENVSKSVSDKPDIADPDLSAGIHYFSIFLLKTIKEAKGEVK